VSYAERIARLAARVTEARRPKHLHAATRLAQPAKTSETIVPAPAAMPVWTPTPERRPAHPPASSLPVSGEAARWLTRGEVPADLIPLLGDPLRPATAPGSQQPQSASPDPSRGHPEHSSRGPQHGLQRDGASTGQVVARIVEGAHLPSAASSSRVSEEERALEPELPTAWPDPSTGQPGIRTGPPQPSATVEELPGTRRESPPLLRLARTPPGPQAPALDPIPGLPAAPAPATPAISAQELARLSGGELRDDGVGQSTVTFAPSGSPGGPPAKAPDAGLPAKAPDAGPPAKASDAELASETPSTPALRAQLGDLDLDELYEGFLQRLRRELLHDRERLGDLLGPLP
jgi:hypothetical protein